MKVLLVRSLSALNCILTFFFGTACSFAYMLAWWKS
jgi:hypothetical protein